MEFCPLREFCKLDVMLEVCLRVHGWGLGVLPGAFVVADPECERVEDQPGAVAHAVVSLLVVGIAWCGSCLALLRPVIVCAQRLEAAFKVGDQVFDVFDPD